MTASYILNASPRVRYTSGAMLYFAQGIPQGLLSIAVPAWLASLGVSAGQIGSYLAVVILPWAFKLVTGPLMDRFEYLPMGRRRPWVLAAQLGLTLSLLALMLVDQPAEQLGLLMSTGFIINCFAATQDVATDGMAIDLTPVNEQGRLNAFMTFGKAAGWSATAAVSGLLLVTYGMQVTAIVAAAAAGLVFLLFVLVLERDGERALPWSSGEAGSKNRPSQSFSEVFGGLNSVLWSRVSLTVMGIMLFDGLVSGYGQALMPVAAITVFGYTTPQWSQLVALMGLAGALLALVLGPLVDRYGARRMLIATATLVGIHAFMLAQTQFLWQDSIYVRVMLSFWVLMLPVVMVCSIALAMSICSSSTSATQFAIYMSIANLGHSAGSKMFGMISDNSSFVRVYELLAVLVVVMIVVLTLYPRGHKKTPRHSSRPAPKYTVGFGSGHGGMFFSGAMRCPKCRSDMDQVVVDGVEIDRCSRCSGIWFDAGEAALLSNKEAAAAVDTGDAHSGRILNLFDQYNCPRCGGDMERIVDAHQQHIWYESCTDCLGSFFDAGEFLDLSQVTVTDFFRRLATPRRI